MQYLHKGDKITVVGDLVIRPYLGKNGVERTSVQVSITDMELPAQKTQAAPPVPPEDDLPI